MAKTKTISLTNLWVNTENYRFESVSSQKEAIDKMIDDQGDKLYNLAQDMVVNGLNPNDKVQVVASNHDPKKFNVLEGNRRTVTLKILGQPDLIDSDRHHTLKKKFRKLHDDNKGTLIREVECTVYDNATEADKWIKLKHAGQSDGIGTVAWTAQQVQRFEEKVEGKSSIALQAVKILEKASSVPPEIKSNLRSMKITNFDRLLSDPSVRDFLGIDINNNVIQSDIEEKEVVKGLTQMAKDLLNPKFKVGQIYTKQDRKDYIAKFAKGSTPNLKVKAAKPWQFSEGNSSASATKPAQKQRPIPKERDILIPRSCHLQINVPKINSLYHELQKLPLSKFTNVAAVSIRVFIENSLDSYIEHHKMIKTAQQGLPLSKDSKLTVKTTEVAEHMEKNGFADKHITKGIKSAVSNKSDLLSVETLHAYVHNAKFSAISTNLVITWDNIQVFMERLWANIK